MVLVDKLHLVEEQVQEQVEVVVNLAQTA